MDQGRPYQLSELRSMDRKSLFELANSHRHLWPANAGPLNTKTTVATMERALSDRNGGYRTNAPLPANTTASKRRRGGRKSATSQTNATNASNMMQIHPPSSPAVPEASSNPFPTTSGTNHEGISNDLGEILITIHVIDKRENPAAEIAVDTLVHNKFISHEGCIAPRTFKVKASEIVRVLELKSIIRGLIKLSTPHHRIPSALQPFLVARTDHLTLLETPLMVEYLTAVDNIVRVTVEYALSAHEVNDIVSRLKRKREEREEGSIIESSPDAPEASTSMVASNEQVPIHIARVQTNLRKATGSSRASVDDKSKALKWLTEQVVARESYALFNRLRGSDRAQNPDIVKLWLFVAELADEYLNKLVQIPDVSSKVKITKKMLFESLAIHETSFNTILRAASLIRRFGEDGPDSSMEVITRLTKVVPIDRASGNMPEGRKKLLEFLEDYDSQHRNE
ncbi:hypothetical protein C8R42DRAFT_238364 [Lentinula raphanica]|nr:hypothetical protein C8R42DRAFT_646241 [Lentinula raphanica]KAJ3714795.1 hypothetical protein C8R42DRAFT_747394 [Lentinula raphanica]KAJ3714797.1 hypothetical protein C8R42DRAFT_238364 [Lentinula raphanica]